MSSYTKILEDLHRTEPANTIIMPPFHQQNDTTTQQMNSLLRQLRRAKSLRNRVETMIILWYLGEVIETKTTTPMERSQCLNLLTAYYQRAALRVYYLFELVGIEQIPKTIYTSVGILSRLNRSQHQQLVQEAGIVAGARILEEEVVSDSLIMTH
jgi:hypothetical protein